MFTLPPIPAIDHAARANASARQAQLTKPAGALGRLEEVALRLAGIQGRERPRCERAQVLVFAADHGVAKRGVSAYPAEVTAQMCHTFCAGGAAVNVLARQVGALVEVVDVGVATDLPAHPRLIDAKIASGTADFTEQAAMSVEQCDLALAAGATRARAAADQGMHALVLGEMGIANTTSAAALMAAYLGRSAEDCCGRGTGIDDAGLARKRATVNAGLARHRDAFGDPFDTLTALGGFEIAAMAGAMLQGASLRLAVVVDGFASSAAALAAINLDPAVKEFLVWSHCGAERAHRELLEAVDAEPLLDLGLRLGEGTGGALALHLMRAACRTLDEMATFEQAGVADGSPLRAALGGA
jgi:nicotinate-nucleotide--dimethylbenzimidazole phosphoribosyltransferase